MSGYASIEAIAYIDPPHRVTSREIDEQISGALERFGLPVGRLEELTGIRERRLWDSGAMPSEVATLAARKLLDEVDIDPQEIGCLINTSVCRDYIEPSVACLVHGNLGLSPHCINFDVTNACLGFVNGINLIDLMMETHQIKYGLVVNGEDSREALERTIALFNDPKLTLETFRENYATLTLGSGAVAMLLAHRDVAREGHFINGSVNMADTRYNRLCLGKMDQMKSDPQKLLKAGVELAIQTWQLASDRIENWGDEYINLYAPHQVSIRHTRAVCNAVGIDMDKVHLNIYTHGNVGPAGLPTTLAMADEKGHLQAGDQVALLGIGSGINCMMMSVHW